MTKSPVSPFQRRRSSASKNKKKKSCKGIVDHEEQAGNWSREAAEAVQAAQARSAAKKPRIESDVYHGVLEAEQELKHYLGLPIQEIKIIQKSIKCSYC